MIGKDGPGAIADGEQEPIRLFVSSTFRDMKAERDHLVTVVLPELRDRLRPLGLEIYDIDLRWGVPEHEPDGENANSWAYCKRWIDLARPFFLCLLGQRYGWIPPPLEIDVPADLLRWQGMSITEMEVRHAVLAGDIEPRRSFFFFRDSQVPPPPATAEEVYREFVDPEHRARMKALRREIERSGRPVRSYTPNWCEDHFEGLEDFGARVLADLWSGILRDPRHVPGEAWAGVTRNRLADPRRVDESKPLEDSLARQLVSRVEKPSDDAQTAQRRASSFFTRRCLRRFRGRRREAAELIRFARCPAQSGDGGFCVLQGPPGQGKSSLVAHVATELSDPRGGDPPCAVIAHYVGVGNESAAVRSLLLFVSTEITRRGLDTAADAPGRDVLEALDLGRLRLNLARQLRDYQGTAPLVILLDGLNQLSDGHDLAWLPVELAPPVRLIVSCLDRSGKEKGAGVQAILSALDSRRPAPRRVRLGGLDPDDIRDIVVEYFAEYCKKLSAESLELLCLVEAAQSPLYLFVLLRELRTPGGNELNQAVPRIIRGLGARYPDATSLFEWVLQRLEVFGLEAVSRWCGYLVSSRDGLSSRELSRLLERRLGEEGGRNALRIERGLRPYLQARGDRLDFFHGQLAVAARRRYGEMGGAFPLAVEPLHREIAGYFQQSWPQGDVHALGELPFHLLQGGLPDQFVALLGNYSFLSAKLEKLSPQQLIADCDLALHSDRWSTAPALDRASVEALQGTIRLAAAVLADDPSQLRSQLAGRVEPARGGAIGRLATQARHAPGSRWLRPRCASLPTAFGVQRFAMRLPGADRLQILPDNRIVVAGRRGFHIVDGHRGEILRELVAPMMIGAWQLARDPERVAAVTPAGEILIWDLNSGQVIERQQLPVEILPGYRHGYTPPASDELFRRILGRACFTPDLRLVVLGDATGTDPVLLVWDLECRQAQTWLEGHVGQISAIAAGTCGHSLVSGADDGRVIAFELESEDRSVLFATGQPVIGLQVIPGSRQVLIGRDDDQYGLLEVADLVPGVPARPLGRVPWVHDFAVSRDGRRIAVANGAGEVGLFHLDTDTPPVWMPGHPKSRYASGKPVAALSFNDDESQLYTAGMDRMVRVWDAQSGSLLHTLPSHEGPVESLAAGRGDLLASLCNRGGLRIWDLAHADARPSVQKHDQPVWVLSPGSAPGTIVSGSFDATLATWDLATGSMLRRLHGHEEGRIHDLVTTPGGVAVSCSDDETLRVWNLEQGELLQTLQGHSDSVHCVLVTGDGQRVISGSRDGTLRLWDLHSGEPLPVDEKNKHQDWIWKIALAPDGQVVASASLDGTVKIWDACTGGCLQTLNPHCGEVRGLSFVGDWLVAGMGNDTAICVFPHSRERAAYDEHLARHVECPGRTCVMAALPSRCAVACASLQGGLWIADLEGDEPVEALRAERTAVRSLSLSPSGETILLATDGGLEVWNHEGIRLARFVADAQFTGALAVNDLVFVGADRSGRVHFLDLVHGDGSAI